MVLAQGLVGGGGLRGIGGDGGQAYYRWRIEGAVACGSPGPSGRGSWRAKDARLRRAVAGAVVAVRASAGSGRGGPCGPDASAAGRHAGAAGVGGLGASGLPGVGPTPVPPSATVLVYRTTRRRLGAAIVGLATSFGRYGYRRVTALPPSRGAGVWPRGAVPAAQGGAVCGRPAAPGPGRAPPVRSSRLGLRSDGGANPQTGGPYGCRPRQDERTRQPSLRPRRPGVPGPTSVLSSLTEAVRLPTGRFPRTRAPATRPRVHQPGRAGPAWPRRYPPALHLARQPQKRERPHPKGLQQQAPATGHTDRETPPSRKPRPPGRGSAPDQQPAPAPTAPQVPPTSTPNHHTHTHLAPNPPTNHNPKEDPHHHTNTNPHTHRRQATTNPSSPLRPSGYPWSHLFQQQRECRPALTQVLGWAQGSRWGCLDRG